MQMPAAHPAFSLPTPSGARMFSVIGLAAKVLAATLRALRFDRRGVDRRAAERAAVAGLNERMLKDIGASPWLISEAAARSRDVLQSRLDVGLY